MCLIEEHLKKSLKELNKAYIITESIDFAQTKNLEILIDQIKQIKNEKIDTTHALLLWSIYYSQSVVYDL